MGALLAAPAVLVLSMWMTTPALGAHKDGHDSGAAAQSTSDNTGGSSESNSKANREAATQTDTSTTSTSTVTIASATTGCGDYCNTPGNPSGNGGNGGAPHEAGSKGNADNKNPPGQFQNGGDANGGYECDNNNGVAKGNPAHSGCVPPANPPGPNSGRTEVLGDVTRRGGTEVSGEGAGRQLAFTGLSTMPMIAAALGLAALGGMLVFTGRKKEEQS